MNLKIGLPYYTLVYIALWKEKEEQKVAPGVPSAGPVGRGGVRLQAHLYRQVYTRFYITGIINRPGVAGAVI